MHLLVQCNLQILKMRNANNKPGPAPGWVGVFDRFWAGAEKRIRREASDCIAAHNGAVDIGEDDFGSIDHDIEEGFVCKVAAIVATKASDGSPGLPGVRRVDVREIARAAWRGHSQRKDMVRRIRRGLLKALRNASSSGDVCFTSNTMPILRVTAADDWYKDKDFLRLLNAPETATWHVSGKKADESSDMFTHYGGSREGSDYGGSGPTIPEWIWEEIGDMVEDEFDDRDRECLVWISKV